MNAYVPCYCFCRADIVPTRVCAHTLFDLGAGDMLEFMLRIGFLVDISIALTSTTLQRRPGLHVRVSRDYNLVAFALWFCLNHRFVPSPSR